MNYRTLQPQEIALLEQQGCTAEAWSAVQVAEGFRTETVRNVQFSGQIRLGAFDNAVCYPNGLRKPSGIYQSTLHEVSVGNNCRIAHVTDYLAHYDIADGAVVEQVSTLYTEGKTSFGNGTSVSVLKEDGGREVVMYEQLSAQNAYLQCTYRHDSELQAALGRMAEKFATQRTGTRGYVGKEARITNCGTVRNVWINDGCRIEGATLLNEGTLGGTPDAPACIGTDVSAEQFILLRGAMVDGGASLLRCFVGEASHIGRGFTATDSLVFANCQLECGEACALFAGPFTVSHHKATLLIGVMTSFMNAGSGTNESNHSYKLGPLHYGILERGSRTGSNCYLLWPTRIGIFSTILGDVKHRLDTHNLPFSYIIGEGSTTYIAPGAMLRSIGTWRDADKWPKRDKRTGFSAPPTDLLHADIFTHATASRLIAGIHTLEELRSSQGLKTETYTYQGATIRRSSLEKGLRLYTLAAQYIVGNLLFTDQAHLSLYGTSSMTEKPTTTSFDKLLSSFYWVDVAGALLTESELENILSLVRSGTIETPDALNTTFREADAQSSEWSWPAISSMQTILTEDRITTPEIYCRALNVWQQSSEAFLKEVLNDSKKEFAHIMQITSGIDSRDYTSKEKDFAASGATIDNYPIIRSLTARIEQVKQQVDRLLNS